MHQLTLITGSMFAGKSTALVQAKGQYDGMMFKPSFDTRDSLMQIVTHDGRKADADVLSCIADIGTLPDGCNLFFDEVQFFEQPFFDGDFIYLIHTLRQHHDIWCAGLDMDYMGEQFNITKELYKMATTITRLSAICSCCGESATMTFKSRAGERFELGSEELYEPRCVDCWKKGMGK